MRRPPLFAAILLLMASGVAEGQTTVLLPDTSQTTSVSATISDQARITVPSAVSFYVANVGAATAASPVAVTVEQIVLATATKQLRLSLRANTASFTGPVGGATTWAAGDVSWTAATWTGAVGVSGILSDAMFNTIATCTTGVSGCATSGLVFSLAPKPTVQRAGTHTIVVTWKFESIGS